MLRNQKGQGMVEYILIVAFVVITSLVIWKAFGKTIAEKVQAAEYDIRTTAPDKVQPK